MSARAGNQDPLITAVAGRASEKGNHPQSGNWFYVPFTSTTRTAARQKEEEPQLQIASRKPFSCTFAWLIQFSFRYNPELTSIREIQQHCEINLKESSYEQPKRNRFQVSTN